MLTFFPDKKLLNPLFSGADVGSLSPGKKTNGGRGRDMRRKEEKKNSLNQGPIPQRSVEKKRPTRILCSERGEKNDPLGKPFLTEFWRGKKVVLGDKIRPRPGPPHPLPREKKDS